MLPDAGWLILYHVTAAAIPRLLNPSILDRRERLACAAVALPACFRRFPLRTLR
jgi:hypothetical protein